MQKLDKGSTIVILNKNDYILRLNQILDDPSKFKTFHVEEDKALIHIIHMEERIVNLLKKV